MASKSSTIDHGNEGFSKALAVSIFGHVLIFLFVLIKSVVFPGQPVVFVPTLRVDLVGLPDLLKKDLKNVPNTDNDTNKLIDQLNKAETDAKRELPPAPKIPVDVKPPKETAAPNEMVLKPKTDFSRKNQSALARIKALDKISAEVNKPSSVVIKGNQVSKGTSLSADAREGAEASYYDRIRDRIADNWDLNAWTARQKLRAKVQIFIDNRGMLTGVKFVEPSGNAQFDEAVKTTLKESQPFPIPPKEISQTVMVEGILFVFPL